jgi:hypothetical protein
MDLLQCPGCRQRFIVAEAGTSSQWRCVGCKCELELIARSIPGPAERVAEVLSARFLDQSSELTDAKGIRPQPGDS